MAYILRAQNLGKKSMPYLGELLGIKVYTSGDNLPQDDDYCFRWGCTAGNPGQTKVLNKVKAIETASEKGKFRYALALVGLAGETYLSVGDYLDSQPTEGRAFIVRPGFHQRSQDIAFCDTPRKVYEAWKSGGYISQFIKKKQEFRVMVCQNRVLWVIEKLPTNKEEISWGCVSDGNFKYIDWSAWPKHIVENAMKAVSLSGLDFGAVDVMVSEDDIAYTAEVNTAPWMSPYYNKCVAKAFKWIIKNGREHFPEPATYEWKEVIHPAIMKNLEQI